MGCDTVPPAPLVPLTFHGIVLHVDDPMDPGRVWEVPSVPIEAYEQEDPDDAA